MTIQADDAALLAALDALPTELQRHVNDAAAVTARAIVHEMRARLERQLSDEATGKTVGGIHAQPAYDGNGWVILSDAGGDQIANLPLWLEKGTRAGRRRNFARTEARPFFYSSIALEVGNHERRIVEAQRAAAVAVGLGS